MHPAVDAAAAHLRGSNYFMTHRCTIITRLYTSEGIVGEVYNGDEFETQAEVLRIIIEEIAAEDHRHGRLQYRGLLAGDAASRPTISCAIASSASARMACVDSAIWDAVGKALDVPLYKLWGGFTDTLPIVCIAGYYEEGKTLADFGREMEQIRARGLCRLQVQGRRPHAGGGRRAGPRRARRGRRRFRPHHRRQPGLTRSARRSTSRASASKTQDIRWFEEPVRWFNDRTRHGLGPQP